MNKIIVFILSIIILGCTQKEDSIKLHQINIVEAVYASGEIKSKNQYNVYPEKQGVVEKILVEEGDQVYKGQILFQIGIKAPSIELETSRNRLKLAELNAGVNSPILNELRTTLSSLKSKYEQDSIYYLRFKALFFEQATSQSSLDNAKLIFESSKGNYKSAIYRYEQTVNVLKEELKVARNNVNIKKEFNQELFITSNITGRIYGISIEEGEYISPAKSIAIIGNSNEFELSLEVDELDYNKVLKGQKVVAKTDAYAEKILSATVSKIIPRINSRTQSFQIRAMITEDSLDIIPGMSIEANIIIGEKENAYVIPNEYIDKDGMLTLENGHKISFGKGLSNLEYSEVLNTDTANSFVKP